MTLSKPLNRYEFEQRMKIIEFQHHDDSEQMHLLMDELMCAQLEALGFDAGIDIFREAPRFYA